jgi:uncharacterized membrane protein
MDLILIFFCGGIVFVTIDGSAPPWLAHLSVFSLLAIVARLWYLSLTSGK